MGTFDAEYRVHLCFGPNCTLRGSRSLLPVLREELERAGIADKVEVIETGCRNRCDFGPSMNVYPGPWFYNELTPEAIHDIVVGHLAGGEPVTRWLFRPALASGRDPDRARGRSGW